MTITHFSAVLLFAFFTSIVFGITQRSEPKSMLRYGAYCFAMFTVGAMVASWVMWLIRR